MLQRKLMLGTRRSSEILNTELHETKRKTRLMRCHCLEIQNRVVAGQVPTENPEVPGGARDQEFQEEHMIQ